MAHLDTTRPYAAPKGLHSARLIRNVVTSISDWNNARQARRSLSRLSTEELADIGLDHGDMDVVAEGRRKAR